MFLKSKCRGDSDLGLFTFWVLAKREPLRNGDFRKKTCFAGRKNRNLALRISFFLQVFKKCTDLDRSLLCILTLKRCSKFARENDFLALGVYFPQPCSSAGRRFAASRLRLKNYQRIVSFAQQKIDEMRCKLDSAENPCSFEKYPTPP